MVGVEPTPKTPTIKSARVTAEFSAADGRPAGRPAGTLVDFRGLFNLKLEVIRGSLDP